MIRKLSYFSSVFLLILIIINFLINFVSLDFKINFFDILLGLLMFLYLFLIGNLINYVFNIKNISASILMYLLSFFVIDIITLFLLKTVNFNEMFLFVNFLWFVSIAFNLEQKRKLLGPIISLVALKYIFSKLKNELTFNKNLTGDVEAVFFGQSKNIYENSYYFSVNNYVMEGYPQLSSYIQSIFLQIAQQNGEFVFYAFTSHLIFYMSILFFLELKISKENKLFLILTFSVFIFNSKWIQFLFTTSLMSEGIVSLFIAIGIHFVIKRIYKTKSSYSSYVICFIFSSLYFLKQFNSLIFILFAVCLFIFDRKNLQILLLLSGVFLKELMYRFVFIDVGKDHHIRQIDLQDTIFDLILFRDLKLNNILLILKNLLIDKPLTILLLVFLFSLFINIKKNKFFNSEFLTYFLTVSINFLLIFSLYVSVWKSMELDSPIRYMLNLLHVVFVSIFINLDSYKKKFIRVRK